MTIAVSHFCATLLPSRLVAGKSEMGGPSGFRVREISGPKNRSQVPNFASFKPGRVITESFFGN